LFKTIPHFSVVVPWNAWCVFPAEPGCRCSSVGKGGFYILYIKGVKRKSKAEKRFLKKIHKKEGFLTAALEALITHIGRN